MTYLDMAMTLSEPHPERPFELTGVKLGDYQFERAEAWEERACSRSSGSGSSRARPTSSRVTQRTSSSREIDEVGIRDGASLVVEGYDFAPTFSIWTTIEECLNPPVVWERDRGWFTTEPFSEPEVFDFPEGIGPVECVNVEHEEVLLVPRWIDCRRVTFKYGLGDEFIEVLRTLHKLGLDGKEPIRSQGPRGRTARRRRRGAPGSCDARRADEREDVRRARSSPARESTAARGGPTCTTSSTPSSRCASTAHRRSSGRPRSTRSSRSSCSPRASGRGRRPRAGGVPGPAVPRQARRVRLAARPARAPALDCEHGDRGKGAADRSRRPR